VKRLKTNDTLISFSSNDQVQIIKEFNLIDAIWSGDVCIRKICMVAWNKVCTPYEEGGLDIRPLAQVNESLILHLYWKLLSSHNQWAAMCRARFLRFGMPTSTHLKSSIWHGIK
jgi:hypothetical protein